MSIGGGRGEGGVVRGKERADRFAYSYTAFAMFLTLVGIGAALGINTGYAINWYVRHTPSLHPIPPR